MSLVLSLCIGSSAAIAWDTSSSMEDGGRICYLNKQTDEKFPFGFFSTQINEYFAYVEPSSDDASEAQNVVVSFDDGLDFTFRKTPSEYFGFYELDEQILLMMEIFSRAKKIEVFENGKKLGDANLIGSRTAVDIFKGCASNLKKPNR